MDEDLKKELITKLQSPVLRGGLVTLVSIVIKKHFDYEFPTPVLDSIMESLLYISITIAIFHNPNKKDEKELKTQKPWFHIIGLMIAIVIWVWLIIKGGFVWH